MCLGVVDILRNAKPHAHDGGIVKITNKAGRRTRP
jgi:hypothetical protein